MLQGVQASLPFDDVYFEVKPRKAAQRKADAQKDEKPCRSLPLPFDHQHLAVACRASLGVDSFGRVIATLDASGRKALKQGKAQTGDVFAVELGDRWFDALMGSIGTLLVKAPAEAANGNLAAIHIKRRYVEQQSTMSNAGAMTPDIGTRALLPMVNEPFRVTDEGFPGRDVCRNEQRPCGRSKCPYWLYRTPGENVSGRPGLSKVKRDEKGRTERVEGQIEQQEDKPDVMEPGWLFDRPSCELDFHEDKAGKPATTDEIAYQMRRSPSWVRKVQRAGLEKLKARGLTEDAIRAALKAGR